MCNFLHTEDSNSYAQRIVLPLFRGGRALRALMMTDFKPLRNG